MEQRYWLEKSRVSLGNAQAATDAEARLYHYDLAGRYSIKAANSAGMLLPRPAKIS